MVNAEDREEQKACVRMWVAVLAGPVGWLIQFQARYSLVPWVCASGYRFVLHLISLVFLLGVAGAGLVCWRRWVQAGARWPAETDPPRQGRVEFLWGLGILTNTMFGLVIIAQAIPAFILNPCQD